MATIFDMTRRVTMHDTSLEANLKDRLGEKEKQPSPVRTTVVENVSKICSLLTVIIIVIIIIIIITNFYYHYCRHKFVL